MIERIYDNAKESELVLKIATGDGEAMEAFFLCYYKRLCLFADKMTGSQEVAESIAVEALAVLWKDRATLTSLGHARFVIYQYASYAAAYAQTLYAAGGDYSQFNAQSPVPADFELNDFQLTQAQFALIWTENSYSFYKAIPTLDPPYQKLFRLIRQQYSPDQIAVRMNVSLPQLESMKKEAYRLMFNRLEGKPGACIDFLSRKRY